VSILRSPPGDPSFHDRFGTGLLSVFGHVAPVEPAAASGDSPGAAEAPDQVVNLSIGTYPQLSLDNPTRSVPRGVVAPGPSFYLPVEINWRLGPIRFDGEVPRTSGRTRHRSHRLSARDPAGKGSASLSFWPAHRHCQESSFCSTMWGRSVVNSATNNGKCVGEGTPSSNTLEVHIADSILVAYRKMRPMLIP
jgi:hypothetical protein